MPILMTALVTARGLLPLAIGFGKPGHEIESPMAIVILGGLLTSTVPAWIFHRGRDAALRRPGAVQAPNTLPDPADATSCSAAARGGDGAARRPRLSATDRLEICPEIFRLNLLVLPALAVRYGRFEKAAPNLS